MSNGESPRRGRNLDRVLGVLLGLILGIAIVTAFVFLGSEDTIDAPRIETTAPAGAERVRPGSGTGQPGNDAGGRGGNGETRETAGGAGV